MRKTLPAAYQVDHIVPLAMGGPDSFENLQALCPNCHADKTQQEAISRRMVAEEFDPPRHITTAKTCTAETLRCLECGLSRAIGTDHTVCWKLERRFNPNVRAAQDTRIAAALDQFRFKKRAG